MAKSFPQIDKAISTDKLRFHHNCIYVKDGYLYGTNVFVAVKIDLRNYISDEVQLKNLEGKVLTRDVFNLLEKAKEITFNEHSILIENRKGTEIKYYYAQINYETKDFFLYDKDKLVTYPSYADYKLENISSFRNVAIILERLFNDVINEYKNQPKTYNKSSYISISPKKLSVAFNSLNVFGNLENVILYQDNKSNSVDSIPNQGKCLMFLSEDTLKTLDLYESYSLILM